MPRAIGQHWRYVPYYFVTSFPGFSLVAASVVTSSSPELLLVGSRGVRELLSEGVRESGDRALGSEGVREAGT